MPAGRPSGYQPQYAAIAEQACKVGLTDDQIAELFEVSTRTLYRWKNEFPDFCQALKAGKELADDRVERSLYQRAVGYRAEAVKIFMPSGASEPIYAPFVEEHAPDTTAAIFWLKNRRPQEWRDRIQQEVTGKDGGPIETSDVSEREITRRIAMALASGVKDGA